LDATVTAPRLGDLGPLRTWLLDHLPPDGEHCIVHGDYGFHNLLVDRARVTAVLDWELATVGDPLADLAFFVKSWGPGRLSKNPAQDDVALRPGAPDRAALEQRYAAVTGRDVGAHRRFYDVFGLWRSIGIQEGVHARSGGAMLTAEVPAMVATALALIGRE
jgi:aminoglycoside phosphotransferase (APT) family kinase protein